MPKNFVMKPVETVVQIPTLHQRHDTLL